MSNNDPSFSSDDGALPETPSQATDEAPDDVTAENLPPEELAEARSGDDATPEETVPGRTDATAPDLEGAAGALEEEAPPAPPESPYDRPGQWFVIHSYAGYENKVKSNLESRIASMNMEERIFEVVIPMEDVIEFKNGKKQVVSKKVFPGYLLVRV